MLELLELIKIIILSVVQGITEWLPISSTGHMKLINELMPLQLNEAFVKMFFVVVQFGSILAVLLLYFNKLNPFSWRKSASEKRQTWLLWSKVLVATVPTLLFGVALDDLMEAHLSTPFFIAVMLIVYGVGFIWLESSAPSRHAKKVNDLNDISYVQAFYMGLFQSLALFPGTSRSGATIMGGLILGFSRFVATEFSFFMSIPVMFGASSLKLGKYVLTGNFTSSEWIYLLTGMLVAFIVSIIVIKLLLGFLKRNDFKGFGYYRIVLGIVVLLYFYLF
ncbi:MAG: undecaprenyl-diphosphate phosphatase [Aerococcaceae bacterium]|nr:undecaprenyl-diphosphate phosphatase [Aerococcaceae bacterium]